MALEDLGLESEISHIVLSEYFLALEQLVYSGNWSFLDIATEKPFHYNPLQVECHENFSSKKLKRDPRLIFLSNLYSFLGRYKPPKFLSTVPKLIRKVL